jgi:hypothetical protein
VQARAADVAHGASDLGARGSERPRWRRSLALLVSALAVTLAVGALAFTSMYGRPSADEYLLGAVSTGYLPERPDVPLFQPSGNFVRDYLAGTISFVRLGWDSYLNAAVFQMLPAVGVRYLGPVATQAQGLFNSAVLVLLLYVIAAVGLRLKSMRISGVALALVGLVGTFTVSNFGTYLPGFGLFPFTGVRYSLYLLFSLSLVSLIVWSCRVLTDGARRFVWLLTGSVGFSALVSQWFVMYWVVALFITLVLVTVMPSLRSMRNATGLAAAFVASGASAALANDFFRGLLGRTAVGANSGSGFVDGVFAPALDRSFREETLSLVFGPSLVAGAIVGCALYLLCGGCQRRPHPSTRLLTFVLVVLTLMLPLIFSIQEAMTYEAHWHRTMPICISFLAWMTASYFAFSTVRSRPLWFSSRGAAILAISCLLAGAIWTVSVADRVTSSFRVLQAFSMAWDAGDPLGRGSPIENVYDWNVRDLQRVEANPGSDWPSPFCIGIMFGPKSQCPSNH